MTKYFPTRLLVLASIIILLANCQDKEQIHQLVQNRTDEIFDSLVAVRRDIHQHPEMFFKEFRTSNLVAKYLESLGLEVHRNIGGTGVVAILHGTEERKTIAWRADMDAISSEFPDVVEFASKVEGVRHGCGHDVHTTIGLGMANVLSSIRHRLKGNVVFIFQPAEETPVVRVFSGAQAMIDDGLFNIVKPDELYATHISDFPVGKVSMYPGRFFAYLKPIIIRFNLDSDPEAIKKRIEDQLIKFNSPSIDLWEAMGDPKIGIFGDSTLFDDFVCSRVFEAEKDEQEYIIYGQLASSDPEQLIATSKQIKQVISNISDASNALEIEFGEDYYNHYNDPKLSNLSREFIRNLYGATAIMRPHGLVPGSGDDFSLLQENIPGGYYSIGGSNAKKGIISAPHSPNFAVDESAISYGVSYFSSLIIERLNSE
ncbi:amidohydrolase [Flavobacteriaceae bacterium MAR_2009_75]|nr:amidohydrolase [Flavobacteriaceae bacterium MAR_2009_75]